MKTNVAIALICAVTACNSPKPASEHEPMNHPRKIAQASWLVGTWTSRSKERSNFEAWQKNNDSTFVGRGYSIERGDTVSSESFRLIQEGEAISFIPTVQGQNSNMPVVFKLTSLDSNKMVFENPEHDFPQKITYQKVAQDSLVAEISGLIEGKHHSQQFPMRRME